MSNPPNRQASVDSRRISIEREIAIRLPAFDAFITEYSANVSTTGIFIVSDSPQPPGTNFSFDFSVADQWKLISGKGLVVWTRPKSEGENRPAGMGVKFTELTPQSRRLIRWIVERHIREGGSPFELETEPGFEEATGDTLESEQEEARQTTEPAAQESYVSAAASYRHSRERRRRYLIAGSTLLLGVASLVTWSLTGRSGAEGPPATEPVAESTPDEARLPAQSAPAEAVPLPDLDRVTESIMSWSAAWSQQDVEAYLAGYSAGFRPQSGVPREAWEAQRRQRVAAPEFIRVAITGLQAEALDAENARATFFQSYRSNRLSDTVRKQMTLVWEGGAWKIEEEAVVP